MRPTTISVVIPVHDDAAMLERCLGALAAQSRPADEIIVVDNASTDDTAAVARRHGATVVVEPELGVWAAAATGFDRATAEIIARCDADSLPGESWLASIEASLADRPDAVAVTGPGRFYDLAQPWRLLADVFYMRAYFWWTRGALANHPLFGSNFAIRRSVWLDVRSEVHRHDPDIHDDMDLSYHLHPGDIVVYDDDLVVGISARPLKDARGMVKRVARAFRTIRIHGLRQQPAPRWRRRIKRLGFGRFIERMP